MRGGVGERSKREGIYVYIELIHFIMQRKLTQHSKAICCCCSVSKLCTTLRDPMDCSTPGSPVLHHLPEFAQTHVH